MMHVPITLALLAAIMTAAVLLRIRWTFLSARQQKAVVALAFGALLVQVFMHLLKWEPNSDRMYRFVSWIAVTGYIFLLILSTRIAPRWLTTLSTVILLLPLMAPSLLYPLADIFNDSPHFEDPLVHSLVSVRVPWQAVSGGTSGIDFDIYYRPSWAPFLRHGIYHERLYNGQCDTAKMSVALSADHKHALVSCPPWPDQSTEQSYDLIFPLR